jgi:glutathione S-transferase
MRLYHFPLSTNGRRVTLTARHLGLPLDIVPINLMNPDDRRRMTELNLNNKAPILEDGGFLLWESCAIMQYLAEQVPGQTLYPQDAKARADVNRWLFWSVQHFAPAIGVISWENVWKKFAGRGDTDPVELARGHMELGRFGAVLDAHLAGRDWVCGSGVTLADFALAAPLSYIEKCQLPVTHFPNMMRWLANVQALAAWQDTQLPA